MIAATTAAVLIDVEGHGREEIFAHVDLSRAVGWFTSLYPLRLDAGAVDLAERSPAVAHLVGRSRSSRKSCMRSRTRAWLRTARYLNGQTGLQLAELARPQIGFNYLGVSRRRVRGLGGGWRDGEARRRRSCAGARALP